jgi:hypothetical protein
MIAGRPAVFNSFQRTINEMIFLSADFIIFDRNIFLCLFYQESKNQLRPRWPNLKPTSDGRCIVIYPC